MVRIFIFVGLLALLGACSQFEKDKLQSISAREALYALKVWRMDGRVGIKTGADAWQANLFWDHDSRQDRVRISGPFSQGLLSIVIQKDLVLINLGDGRTEISRDPETLLRRRLGFFVPLSSLRYWILGIPDPELPYTSVFKSDGTWSGFQQSGWTIGLDRSLEVGTRVLPGKLLVQGSGVRLKIIADNWEIDRVGSDHD